MEAQFTSEDLRAVQLALRSHANGEELRKQFVKELRGVARPLVPKVRAAWLAVPSKGHGASTRARQAQPDLRALLAKATHSEVRLAGKQAGVRVRTDGRRFPSGSRGLPGLAEGLGHRVDRRPGRWRHPVMGNREVWVDQRPFPRFYATVQPDEAAVRQAAERAVEHVFQQIVRAR